MKRKWLLVILVFCAIILGSIFYFQKFFLPVHFKKIVVGKVQEILDRPVTIGTLDYSLLKGIYITDIVISEKDPAQTPFILIDEISFKLILPSFFKAKGLIIPSVSIKNPQVFLTRRSAEEMNISDIIVRVRQRPRKSSSDNIIIGGFHLEHGKIIYADQTNNFKETLKEIDLRAQFSASKAVKFALKTVIDSSSKPLSVKGTYSLNSKELNMQLQSEGMDVAKYLPIFYPKNNFTLKSGIIPKIDISLNHKPKHLRLSSNLNITGLDLTFNNGKSLQGDFTGEPFALEVKDKVLTVKGNISFKNGKVDLLNNQYIDGDGTISSLVVVRNGNALQIKGVPELNNGKVRIKNTALAGSISASDVIVVREFDTETNSNLYKGSVAVSQGNLTGIPRIESAQNIKGNINFETNSVELGKLSFSTFNSSVTLDGKIQDFSSPALDVNFQTEKIDLTALAAFFPSLTEKMEIATGKASLQGHFKGTLAAWTEADIRVKARIKDAAITSSEFNKTVDTINGDVEIFPNKLVFKNLQGDFQGESLTLDGSLTNFKEPSLDLTLSSDSLELTSQILIQNKKIQLLSLTGFYLDSSIDVKGDILLNEKESPTADLKGTFNINLENLASLSPGMEKKLKSADPKGIVVLDVRLQGPLTEWPNWQLAATAQAPSVSLYGLESDTVNLYYDQRNRFINEGKIIGNLYAGRFVLDTSGDLNRKDQPFFLSLAIEDVDLSQLKEDTNLKNKKLDGTIAANFSANGSLKDISNLEGQGSLEIAQGHLGEFNLFKGIWETLLIPEFLDVVFTDGHADFKVKNQRIATPNLYVKSKQVELNGKGWIDFKKNVNLSISPSFSEIALIESVSGLKRIPTSVLTKNSDIVTIKITGTLDRPKYLPITDPTKVIKKTTGAIWQGIEDIFSEIF